VDLRADQAVLDRVGDAGPADRDRDLGSGVASQRLDRLVVLPAFGRLAVHLDDLVAGLDAGTLRRSFRKRCDHGDPPVSDIDLDAQTGVVARGLFGESLVVIAGQEDRVGILELLEHPPGGLLVQVGLADRVDEIGADMAQDVVEEAGLLIDVAIAGHALLQEPTAAQERDHCYQANHTPALPHNYLRSRRIADIMYCNPSGGVELGPDG